MCMYIYVCMCVCSGHLSMLKHTVFIRTLVAIYIYLIFLYCLNWVCVNLFEIEEVAHGQKCLGKFGKVAEEKVAKAI